MRYSVLNADKCSGLREYLKNASVEDSILIPKELMGSKELDYLGASVVRNVLCYEQLGEVVDVNLLIREIKTHPDKDEEIFDNYLLEHNYTVDTLPDKELDNIPTVPLTVQDILQSIEKLKELGYIIEVPDETIQ